MLYNIYKYDETLKYISSEEKEIPFGEMIPPNSTLSSPFPIPEGKEAFFDKLTEGWVYKDPSVATIPVTNVVVSGANKVGDIWWVQVGSTWTLTADVTLPNGQMMVMLERIVDGLQPVDDVRFIASITSGKLTISGKFDQSGNYTISKERLNRGLERIKAPFRLDFALVEFDAYVAIQ
jgi:hypothetical protein